MIRDGFDRLKVLKVGKSSVCRFHRASGYVVWYSYRPCEVCTANIATFQLYYELQIFLENGNLKCIKTENYKSLATRNICGHSFTMGPNHDQVESRKQIAHSVQKYRLKVQC